VVPLVRKRYRVPAPLTAAAVATGPFALAVLQPRTKKRDAAVFALQMWAFTILHELPYDDPDRLRERLHVKYPIAADRKIGLGDLPTHRLQRALSRPGHPRLHDVVLALIHWAWFFVPHLALTWIIVRDEERFARSARQMAFTYDIGAAIYALVPTAPPWWAGENGYTSEPVRRLMVEVGEPMWGKAWDRMYDSLGGNPWAAMPSLHFATSLMAAILLAESGRAPGAIGWVYAVKLGFALVYLGEHYVIDLLVGTAIVLGIRAGEPVIGPVAERVGIGVQRLERLAAG
jgi:membrane-associated phospholipid phosphatase